MNNCGIIEGFFGDKWKFEDRNKYPKFLKDHGYKFYIYAPKADQQLRSKWQHPLSQKYINSLVNFSQRCHKNEIDFGIGFTPMGNLNELCHDPSLLLERIEELNEKVPLDYFALLFDDLKNQDRDELGALQLKLVDLVFSRLKNIKRFIVCPSYYSTDPILEKVFGEKPKNYWNEFADGLDQSIDLFWTGQAVMSKSYSREHLEWFITQFKRKPFLWDNYPVNDGKKTIRYLNIAPYADRPSYLDELTNGHAVNPMIQPLLSQIPLATLSYAYKDQPLDPNSEEYWLIVKKLAGNELANLLRDDYKLCTEIGVEAPTPIELQERYESFIPSPFGYEVFRYMAGMYVFDPKCLTS